MDSYIDLIGNEPDPRIKSMITRDFSNILISYEKDTRRLKRRRIIGDIIVIIIAVLLLHIFWAVGGFEIGAIVGIAVISFGLIISEDICAGNLQYWIKEKQRERKKSK
jgi:hypothetical protein